MKMSKELGIAALRIIMLHYDRLNSKKVHVYRIILRLVLNKRHVMKKQSPEIILIKSNCMATSLVNGTLVRPFVIWPIWNWLNLLSILTNH